jgi:hypothetical protein
VYSPYPALVGGSKKKSVTRLTQQTVNHNWSSLTATFRSGKPRQQQAQNEKLRTQTRSLCACVFACLFVCLFVCCLFVFKGLGWFVIALRPQTLSNHTGLGRWSHNTDTSKPVVDYLIRSMFNPQFEPATLSLATSTLPPTETSKFPHLSIKLSRKPIN